MELEELKEKIITVVRRLYATPPPPEDTYTEPPKFNYYPFPKAYRGHNRAIESILNSKISILSAPTGTGKTAVYLTAAANLKTNSIIIVPRNGLQAQILAYERKSVNKLPFDLYALYAREKMCNKKIRVMDDKMEEEAEEGVEEEVVSNGEIPLCNQKISGSHFILTKEQLREICSGKDRVEASKIVNNLEKYREGDVYYIPFPCSDCPYEEIVWNIKVSGVKAIPILNHGNFWLFRDNAKFVVIDEADLTLSSIKEAVQSKISPEDVDGAPRNKKKFKEWLETSFTTDPLKVLDWMAKTILVKKKRLEEKRDLIRKEIESGANKERREELVKELRSINRLIERYERKLRKIEIFCDYPDKLFAYIKETNKGIKIYVELFEENLEVITRKLFSNAERIVLVTATPSIYSNTQSHIYFELPFPRVGTIYAPLENLSKRNLDREGDSILENALGVVVEVYEEILQLTNQEKAIIHCGNLGTHGEKAYKYLKTNGFNPHLMKKGKQKEAIEEFKKGDYDFLCVVAAEFGYDFPEYPFQVILKYPYPHLGDPRIKALEKYLKDKFKVWYAWEGMRRVIQASGRNTRNPTHFAVTLIVDECFEREYERFKDIVPKWFKERLIWLKPSPSSNPR